MISARKYVAYLLVLSLPLSAWVGAATPCAQKSGFEPGAQIAMVDDMHAHHAAADEDTDSMLADCPCCDDCASACVLSSCSPVTLSTASGLMAFNGTDLHFPDADAFRDGPPLRVLFRPPIFSV